VQPEAGGDPQRPGLRGGLSKGLFWGQAGSPWRWYTPPKAKHKGGRPIANKYRKGKIKRTLERELKELEVVEREAIRVGQGCWRLAVEHFVEKFRKMAAGFHKKEQAHIYSPSPLKLISVSRGV